MAQPGQQPQGSSAGMGTGFLLLFGMGGLFFGALWFVKHDFVARIFLLYSYWIVYIPSLIAGVIGWEGAPPLKLSAEIARHSWKLSGVDAATMFSIVNRASVYLLPFISITLMTAWRVHTHVLRNLESMHDYWELMKIQAKTNPCIVPVVRFTEYWREKGIERHSKLFRSLTPDEFALKHGLLKRQAENEVLIDFDKTNKIFIDQLSEKLEGAVLPEYYKAIAAICMTRIIYRGEEGRKKANEMQDYINNSCDPNKTGNGQDADCTSAFDFSPAASLYDDLINHVDILPIKTYFVYKKTFLMRLLNEARSDGKLAPPEFIWLKLIDRDLWYALYGVSKKLIAKGYAEGSAPFAQYWGAIAAMSHNQVLSEPHMDEAIRGMEKRLFEANMVSERLYMTEKERERELTFGKIPEV